MSDKSGIEWTDATWNPTTGCTKVSPGCDHCYAMTLAERFRGTPGHYYENGFDVQLRPDKLDLPLRWANPKRIFVNSMSDLFHDDVPDEYIAQVFAIMALADRHTFQLLTKRHGRMRSLLNNTGFRAQVATFVIERAEQAPGPPHIPMHLVLPSDGREWWPLPNVWLGVSVEDQHWANIRIPALLDTPAAIRFLSCEPLLGPVSLFANTRLDTGTLVDWVIVGGESGRGARPMLPAWARGLRYECTTHGIPFLFKQWGEWSPCGSLQADGSIDWNDPTAGMERLGKKAAGRELDGRTWDEYPQAVTTS